MKSVECHSVTAKKWLRQSCPAGRSSLDDFEARKADEIYQSLRQRRRQQREQWQRRERRRAELRGTAKVGPQPPDSA